MKRTQLSVLAVVCGVVAVLAIPASAQAGVMDCPARFHSDTARLPHVTITSVRNMTCANALAATKGSGGQPKNALGTRGEKFRLGSWACTITLQDYELWRARCAKGARAFRVDYGY